MGPQSPVGAERGEYFAPSGGDTSDRPEERERARGDWGSWNAAPCSLRIYASLRSSYARVFVYLCGTICEPEGRTDPREENLRDESLQRKKVADEKVNLRFPSDFMLNIICINFESQVTNPIHLAVCSVARRRDKYSG